jgi:serine/threonine-protein kinase
MATVEAPLTIQRDAAPASAATSQPLVGRMGPWQLVKLLGEGNLTRVYLSRPADAPSSQPAAYVVKFLRKEWWRDPQAIEVQRREAWVGSQVSHPNLVPVLSASVKEPPFFIVMPKLEGASLAQVLTEQGRLDIPVALWIARQMADALAALFAATGMIHSDVKRRTSLFRQAAMRRCSTSVSPKRRATAGTGRRGRLPARWPTSPRRWSPPLWRPTRGPTSIAWE